VGGDLSADEGNDAPMTRTADRRDGTAATDPQPGPAVPSSPAVRAEAVFRRASRQAKTADGGNNTFVGAWAAALGISEKDGLSQLASVAAALVQLRQQLEQVRGLARAAGVPPELWQDALQRAENCLGLSNLSGGINQAQIQSDFATALVALAWLAAMLPATENAVPAEELDAILSMINDLEERIRKGRLSDDAKLFLFAQLDILRRAVREYELRGAQALRVAVYHVDGNLQDAGARAAPPDSSEELRGLAKLRRRVKRAADAAVTSERALSAGHKLLQTGVQIAQQIGGLLPPTT
jgi:hypothetical protein